jgi:hypothetical protein
MKLDRIECGIGLVQGGFDGVWDVWRIEQTLIRRLGFVEDALDAAAAAFLADE